MGKQHVLLMALLSVWFGSRAQASITHTYVPTAGSYGSWVFEDSWPLQGDYDFNDVVLDYNIHLVSPDSLPASVASMEVVTRVKARGASYHIGFGISLPSGVTVGSATLLSSGTTRCETVAVEPEDNATGPAFVLFDDAFSVLPPPSGCEFVNTDDPTLGPMCVAASKEFTLHVVFSGTLPSLALLLAGNDPNRRVSGINPFIFRDVDSEAGLRTEIHLAGFAPTSRMNTALFGTAGGGDDRTEYSAGACSNCFMTANGLPWGLDLPTRFVWPLEKIPMDAGYMHFVEWAESAGTVFSDWFESAVGYRNQEVLWATELTDDACSCPLGWVLVDGACSPASDSLLLLDAASHASYPGTGDSWIDLSGRGNHGTLKNGVAYLAASGGTFGFDGTDDFVRLATQPLPTSNFTITAFVRGHSFANIGRFRRIMAIDATGGNENPFCLFVQNGGKLGYVFGTGTSNVDFQVPLVNSPVLATGIWYFVALTFDGVSKRLYVDGTLRATVNNSKTFTNPRANPLLLGTYGIHTEGGYWDGEIAFIEILDRVLDAAEISQRSDIMRARIQ